MNAHLSNKMVESIVAAAALDRLPTKRLSGGLRGPAASGSMEANS
jgi:hypothetical protein